MREADYENFRHRTVMPLQQIQETEMEIRTQRNVRTTKKDKDGKPIILNPDSLTGIYVTTSSEDECCMINQNQKM